MQAQLKVAKGSSSGKLFRIDGQQFIIGRATGCHLRPQSDAISRQHCAFIVKDGHLYVKDLGSRNGTMLNGAKLSSASQVKNGDQVQVGPLHLEVVLTDSAPAQDSTETTKSAKKAAAPVANGEEGGFIDWLMEEDAKEQSSSTSTREFDIDTALSTTVIQTNDDETEEQDKSEKADKKKKKKKKEFGKLPTKGADLDSTENSCDAAADTLRQLYNRGT
jgi:pSer/pThr/pTyr-binding forkhead associated (FHA) protein